MRYFIIGLLNNLLLLTFWPTLGWAEIAVVVGIDSPIVSASRSDIEKVFLAKSKTINGVKVIPIDLGEGDPLRDRFYQNIARKTPIQLKAYWSRVVFIGQANMNVEVSNTVSVKKALQSKPDWIGYIDLQEVDDKLRVIYTVD